MARYTPLLILDCLLRLVGIACFTLFIASIYQMTNKTSFIGYISLATLLPALMSTLFAGKYIHWLSPVGALRLTAGVRVVLFIVVALAAKHLAVLFAAAAMQSLLHQMSSAAKMALDAKVVLAEKRRGYNANKTMLGNIALIAAPPLGGMLISYLGVRVAFSCMASLSVVIVVLLWKINFLAQGQQSESVSSRLEKVSVSFIHSLRHLKSMPQTAGIVIVFCLIAVILEVQSPLLFPFVDEVYQAKSDFTGLLFGLGGLGGISGGFLAQRYPRYFTERSIPWFVVGDGLLFLTFTQIREPVLACILFASFGVIGAVTLIVVEGAIQRDVHTDHQPFTFALMQFAGGAGGASFGVVMAFLAEAYGAKPVLAGAACVEVSFGLCLLGLGWLIVKRKAIKGYPPA